MMAANAGVIKVIVSFYRVNSDMVFERHRSRILINDLNTVQALKKHLMQFLGLKELTLKYGLGDCDINFFPLRECGTARALVLYSFHINSFPLRECGTAGALVLHSFQIHFFPLRECGTAGTLVLHSFHIHIFPALIIIGGTAGAGD